MPVPSLETKAVLARKRFLGSPDSFLESWLAVSAILQKTSVELSMKVIEHSYSKIDGRVWELGSF